MFRRLSEPLPLSEASLLLLRPALNTPVLNVGYLPVGPARAAVVAFAEEYGGIGIALAVRSNESGQLAVLRNQESIDFDTPLADALEPLLDAAEQMGFLFDEDMLVLSQGPKGRSDAMVHWAVFMGGMESLPPPRIERSESQAEIEDGEGSGPLSPSLAVGESQYLELILDDVAPLELPGMASAPEAGVDETLDEEPGAAFGSDLEEDFEEDLEETLEDVLDEARADLDLDWDLADPQLIELDLTDPTTPILAARPAPSPAVPVASPALLQAAAPASPPARAAASVPRVVLSKFRHAEGSSPGAPLDASKAELGLDRSAELARIPIVRIRREAEKRLPFLARLLSSF